MCPLNSPSPEAVTLPGSASTFPTSTRKGLPVMWQPSKVTWTRCGPFSRGMKLTEYSPGDKRDSRMNKRKTYLTPYRLSKQPEHAKSESTNTHTHTHNGQWKSKISGWIVKFNWHRIRLTIPTFI